MSQQPGRSPHAVTTRIGQAVILHRGGDREEARNRLRALWYELGERGSSLERTTVAHFLAETQDDPEEGLAWDLRALAMADAVAGEGAAGGPFEGGADQRLREVLSFYPQLRLSLAAGYARLGNTAAARVELGRARTALRGVRDERAGADLRAAADHLETRLADS